MLASKYGYEDLVSLLIKHGADVRLTKKVFAIPSASVDDQSVAIDALSL
jgi:hypothetical protein